MPWRAISPAAALADPFVMRHEDTASGHASPARPALAPAALPLLGMLFFGNLLKECGATDRLAKAAAKKAAKKPAKKAAKKVTKKAVKKATKKVTKSSGKTKTRKTAKGFLQKHGAK